MRSQIRPAIVSLLVFTVITGIAYPLLVTGVAMLAFPAQAHGSIILRDGNPIGSQLIAQPFTDAKYFWPRPSAASYNGAGGSGSNQGPTNPALAEAVKARVEALKAATRLSSSQSDPSNTAAVPVDLVTASGSGLDPHISVAAARYQLGRVARARNLKETDVEAMLERHIELRTLGALGEPRVNVLLLNLTLDHPDLDAQAADGPEGGGITLYRYRGFMPGSR
ncbi:MAG: potassium-transporting ATPase subunit KdpC [Tepidisphaeraceae bacterium]